MTPSLAPWLPAIIPALIRRACRCWLAGLLALLGLIVAGSLLIGWLSPSQVAEVTTTSLVAVALNLSRGVRL